MEVRSSLKTLAVIAILSLWFAMSAFAKNSDGGVFNLTEPARLGSSTLQPGQYKADWVGPNGDVQVTIWQRHKTVATAEGRVVRNATAASHSAVTMETLPDNSRRVEEINFRNSHYALVLSGM
jgi:hypothetical protein